jgi:hypothetical protein
MIASSKVYQYASVDELDALLNNRENRLFLVQHSSGALHRESVLLNGIIKGLGPWAATSYCGQQAVEGVGNVAIQTVKGMVDGTPQLLTQSPSVTLSQMAEGAKHTIVEVPAATVNLLSDDPFAVRRASEAYTNAFLLFQGGRGAFNATRGAVKTFDLRFWKQPEPNYKIQYTPTAEEMALAESMAADIKVQAAVQPIIEMIEVKVKDLRFSQATASPNLSKGGTVNDLIGKLKSGATVPDDLPMLRVFEKDGSLISLDNRRLASFVNAGIESVPVVKINNAALVAEEFLRKSDPFPVKQGWWIIMATRKEMPFAKELLLQHKEQLHR